MKKRKYVEIEDLDMSKLTDEDIKYNVQNGVPDSLYFLEFGQLDLRVYRPFTNPDRYTVRVDLSKLNKDYLADLFSNTAARNFISNEILDRIASNKLSSRFIKLYKTLFNDFIPEGVKDSYIEPSKLAELKTKLDDK